MKLRQPKIYNSSDLYRPATRSQNNLRKIITILIFFLIVISGAVYLVFYSSFFKIKNIIYENNSKPALEKELEYLKNQNILFFSSEKVKKEIKNKFPEITDIIIIRGLPDTLKIRYIDLAPKLIWQVNDKNYLVSSSGQIYQEAVILNDVPLVKDNKKINVEIGKTVASDSFVKFIYDINDNIADAIELKINHFEINDTMFQVNAITDQGWYIIFDTTRDYSSQLDDLKKFMPDHKNDIKEYIDIRIEGRVYYQ